MTPETTVRTDRRRYTPSQQQFMKSIHPRLVLSGSVGAGKTKVLCDKIFYFTQKYPGNRIMLARKDFSSIRDSTLHTLLHGDERTPASIPPQKILQHNKGRHILTIETADPAQPSEIIYSGLNKGAADAYPKKIGSTQFGAIAVDEIIEIDWEDFQFLESRLRHPVTTINGEEGLRQIMGATNPGPPSHWLYQEFIRKGNAEVVYAKTRDNPHLQDDYLDRLYETYTGMMRDRLLEGEWVAAAGRVYDSFDRETHVRGNNYFRNYLDAGQGSYPETRAYHQIVAGADAGFTNPRACLVAGITGNGSVHVLHEFYRVRTGIEELVEWLEALSIMPETVFHDPSEPLDIQKLNNAGFRTVKANNDIVSGIAAVNRLFAAEDDPASFERAPVIRVHERCQHFIEELVTYRYPRRRGGETPVKEADHLMDAGRYLVQGVATGSGFAFGAV